MLNESRMCLRDSTGSNLVLHPFRLVGTMRAWPHCFSLVLCCWFLSITVAYAEMPTLRMPAESLVTSSGLRATVFGPAPETLADLPENVPATELNLSIDGGMPVPDLFWFNRRLRVWYSAQPEPAPLAVVIAGTGGGGNTQNLSLLRRALYGAGYHVLTMPSPTFPGFTVSASSTGVPGDLKRDSLDLRRATRQILKALPDSVEIESLHVVGYSLGGAHAAFMKHLEEADEAPLGIERVVMINPPVNLFDAIARLDRLFSESIGDSDEDIERFYRRLYADLAMLYQHSEAFTLDANFLLGAAGRLLQSDEEFAAAIALSFRLALVNMFFAGDYYAESGVVIDPDDPPGVGDSLEESFRTLRNKPFSEYFERVFAPFYLEKSPDWTHKDLIAANSLTHLAETFEGNTDFYVQTNRDDLILDATELAWLEATFGDRSVIYDHGGHLGNIGSQHQVADMLDMLAGEWPQPREAE